MPDLTVHEGFFTAGGTLRPTDPSYVERRADRELLATTTEGRYCYVLTPRQMGKSSLMVRCAARLREAGIHVALIDLTAIGTTGVSPEAWYLGQIKRVVTQFGLSLDYREWWNSRSPLGPVQRFSDFFGSVVPKALTGRVVVFVDEIDTTLALPWASDYFAAIRALHNERSLDPDLERLSFVFLGVASPSDLVRDAQRTPFNVGVRIPVTDFTFEEAAPLQRGLAAEPLVAEDLLRQVLLSTGGHPYLTQKVCGAIARTRQQEGSIDVTKILWDQFFSDAARTTDGNLQFVRQWVLATPEPARLLELYQKIRGGAQVQDNELDPFRVSLKLSGLVRLVDGGLLKVRNSIYEVVFDDAWVAKALAEIRGTESATDEAETQTQTKVKINLFKVKQDADKEEKAGRLDKAIALHRQILEDNPRDWSTINKIGDLFARMNRNHEAAVEYAKVADFYARDGFHLKAIAIWKKINKLDASALDPYLNLADLYAKQGLLMEAKSQYQIVVDEYIKRGKGKEAGEVLRKMADIDPADLKVRSKLVDHYTRDGKAGKAIEEMIAIADELNRMGHLSEAVQVLDKGLKIDPENQRLHWELAGLHLARNDAARGADHLDRAIQLVQPLSETTAAKVSERVSRSRALLNEKLLTEAIRLGQQAIQQEPANMEAREILAEAYEALGDFRQAAGQRVLLAALARRRGKGARS